VVRVSGYRYRGPGFEVPGNWIKLHNRDLRKPEGKRQVGRPRHRWEDFKMYIKGIWCNDVSCIHGIPWLILVNMIMDLRDP
jgi:hypothetical protein